ncbi:MAG: GTP 3',8-cyclase MoaA [Undibacterium sp.]|nr:GTP 3',8-cyclase MoaA [Undibacterium sp.]
MLTKSIPIFPASSNPPPAPFDASLGEPRDRLNRPLQDLRISITDRCNFRCTYCMPKDVFHKNYAFLPHHELLSFEEILRLAKVFVELGVRKIRLTGGEPLLRKDVEDLVAKLSQLTGPQGEKITLALTTNGALLARKASVLKAAGLDRITVSLDALDDTIFRRMNDVDFPVAEVLRGIQAAQAVGFENIKINMVVQKGVNDQEIIPMARFFKERSAILRFIEYMDVGCSNGWKLDQVIPSSEILQRLQQAKLQLLPLTANNASETAKRWQYADGNGEIGFISSVSQSFCQDCSRARVSTQGKMYTCLFAATGADLRTLLRDPELGKDDHALTDRIAQVWQNRDDRYSELRTLQTEPKAKVEMSYIGG